MATLWTVTHPGITVPPMMKIPRVAEGEDPAAIVSFEMEQMILPRLAGRGTDRDGAGRSAPAERHSSRHQAEQHHISAIATFSR